MPEREMCQAVCSWLCLVFQVWERSHSLHVDERTGHLINYPSVNLIFTKRSEIVAGVTREITSYLRCAIGSSTAWTSLQRFAQRTNIAEWQQRKGMLAERMVQAG